MSESKFTGFRDFTTEELDKMIKAIGSESSGINLYDWWKQLGNYAKKRSLKKEKGVIIITECGETHHIVPSQTVKEIYIDGILVHSSTGSAKK